ncbi:MAG: hypothetical protein M1831_004236 [Alyxoria varia]|nr:MAG: hypothetical protein M1831_004236 [Alyxoria varia]
MGITPSILNQELSDPSPSHVERCQTYVNGLSQTSRANLLSMLDAATPAQFEHLEGPEKKKRRNRRRPRRGVREDGRKAQASVPSQEDLYNQPQQLSDRTSHSNFPFGALHTEPSGSDPAAGERSFSPVDATQVTISDKLKRSCPDANISTTLVPSSRSVHKTSKTNVQRTWHPIHSTNSVDFIQDIQAWQQQDIQSFWSDDETHVLTLSSHAQLISQFQIGETCETGDHVKLIRWRFNMLFFHDLCNVVNKVFRQSDSPSLRLNEAEVFFISDQISKGANKNNVAVSDTVRRWRKNGRRIDDFASCLGIGALFCFPKLTRYFFEKNYASTGAPHDNAMKHLQSLELDLFLRARGANTLGARIRAQSLKDVMEELCESLQRVVGRNDIRHTMSYEVHGEELPDAPSESECQQDYQGTQINESSTNVGTTSMNGFQDFHHYWMIPEPRFYAMTEKSWAVPQRPRSVASLPMPKVDHSADILHGCWACIRERDLLMIWKNFRISQLEQQRDRARVRAARATDEAQTFADLLKRSHDKGPLNQRELTIWLEEKCSELYEECQNLKLGGEVGRQLNEYKLELKAVSEENAALRIAAIGQRSHWQNTGLSGCAESTKPKDFSFDEIGSWRIAFQEERAKTESLGNQLQCEFRRRMEAEDKVQQLRIELEAARAGTQEGVENGSGLPELADLHKLSPTYAGGRGMNNLHSELISLYGRHSLNETNLDTHSAGGDDSGEPLMGAQIAQAIPRPSAIVPQSPELVKRTNAPMQQSPKDLGFKTHPLEIEDALNTTKSSSEKLPLSQVHSAAVQKLSVQPPEYNSEFLPWDKDGVTEEPVFIRTRQKLRNGKWSHMSGERWLQLSKDKDTISWIARDGTSMDGKNNSYLCKVSLCHAKVFICVETQTLAQAGADRVEISSAKLLDCARIFRDHR